MQIEHRSHQECVRALGLLLEDDHQSQDKEALKKELAQVIALNQSLMNKVILMDKQHLISIATLNKENESLQRQIEQLNNNLRSDEHEQIKHQRLKFMEYDQQMQNMIVEQQLERDRWNKISQEQMQRISQIHQQEIQLMQQQIKDLQIQKQTLQKQLQHCYLQNASISEALKTLQSIKHQNSQKIIVDSEYRDCLDKEGSNKVSARLCEQNINREEQSSLPLELSKHYDENKIQQASNLMMEKNQKFNQTQQKVRQGLLPSKTLPYRKPGIGQSYGKRSFNLDDYDDSQNKLMASLERQDQGQLVKHFSINLLTPKQTTIQVKNEKYSIKLDNLNKQQVHSSRNVVQPKTNQQKKIADEFTYVNRVGLNFGIQRMKNKQDKMKTNHSFDSLLKVL